jgi:hypothetical protein
VRIIGSRVGDSRSFGKSEPAVSQSKLYKQWLPVVDETLTAVGGAGTLTQAASNLGLLPAAKHSGSLPRRITRLVISGVYTATTAASWGESFKRHWVDPPSDNLSRRKTYLALKVGGAVATGGLVASTAFQHFADAKKKQPGGTPLPLPSDSTSPTPTTVATTAPSTSSTPGPTSLATPGLGTSRAAATPHATPTSTSPARRPTRAQAVAAASDSRNAALLGLANPAGPADGTPASAALQQLFRIDASRDGQADKAA